jgi:hypothetical protein
MSPAAKSKHPESILLAEAAVAPARGASKIVKGGSMRAAPANPRSARPSRNLSLVQSTVDAPASSKTAGRGNTTVSGSTAPKRSSQQPASMSRPEAIHIPAPTADFSSLRDLATSYNEIQRVRIATGNRGDKATAEELEAIEHRLKLSLGREFRRTVPKAVRDWQLTSIGVGEHLLARLLGHLGDPVIATPHQWMVTPPVEHICDPLRCGKRHLVVGEPYHRSLRELWAYCGHGDPEARPRKGMSAEEATLLGNPTLKMLTHLIAQSCKMQKGKGGYRDVYEVAKTHYITTHPEWSAGHQDNAAVRKTAKEILRGLWLAAQEGAA